MREGCGSCHSTHVRNCVACHPWEWKLHGDAVEMDTYLLSYDTAHLERNLPKSVTDLQQLSTTMLGTSQHQDNYHDQNFIVAE